MQALASFKIRIDRSKTQIYPPVKTSLILKFVGYIRKPFLIFNPATACDHKELIALFFNILYYFIKNVFFY